MKAILLRTHFTFPAAIRWVYPALVALFAACGSDDPSDQPGCPQVLRSGCKCVDEKAVCEERAEGDGDDDRGDGDGDRENEETDGDGDDRGDGDGNEQDDRDAGDGEARGDGDQGDGDDDEPNNAAGYVGQHGRLRVKGN